MEQPIIKKPIAFSGIQPSGFITLGNYMGALRQWISMQDDFRCVYCVVDEHAITVRQDPKKLRENTLSAYALFLACGVDPQKSVFFIQSHVPAHAELSWILNCFTPFGELSRMTQFKDKSQRHPEDVNAGLFDYPVLMAADILLYQAKAVPIGADQKQHVELARNIVQRFNSIYGDVFTMPEPFIPVVGAKIMDLSDPEKKMSKSADNLKGVIGILDSPDTIIKKFKSAVTDSDMEVAYRPEKSGINNLLTIYSLMTNQTIEDCEKQFAGKGYGDFKLAVGESVVDFFAPIRASYEDYMKNKDYLQSCYRAGAQQAQNIAQRTSEKVSKKVGFVPR